MKLHRDPVFVQRNCKNPCNKKSGECPVTGQKMAYILSSKLDVRGGVCPRWQACTENWRARFQLFSQPRWHTPQIYDAGHPHQRSADVVDVIIKQFTTMREQAQKTPLRRALRGINGRKTVHAATLPSTSYKPRQETVLEAAPAVTIN